MSVFGHIPESHLLQDDVIAAGIAASIERAEEPRKTVLLAFVVGEVPCLSCAAVMVKRIIRSAEAMVDLAEVVWLTDVAMRQEDGEFDCDAVVSEVLRAEPEQRRKMAAEALQLLSYQVPQAQEAMKSW